VEVEVKKVFIAHHSCCYPIFDQYFDKFTEKTKNSKKTMKTPKKCIFDIFASFLAFSTSSQKN